MKEGDHVRIRSFGGTLKAPRGRQTSEDYWRLIGEEGVVVRDAGQATLYPDFSK